MGKHLKEAVSARLPLTKGDFTLKVFPDPSDGKEHLALIAGNPESQTAPLIRIHSECLTGDVFSSLRCDCGFQLESAMDLISKEGGIIVYLRQEGRGIGLIEKLKAYNLQDQGFDTVEANIKLGHKADERDYGIAANILKILGIKTIRLISNNPEKRHGLTTNGIEVKANVTIPAVVHAENQHYLYIKATKLQHTLEFQNSL